MKIKSLSLIFPFFIYQAFAATSAVKYSIPGAVELRIKNGICSGSVVGDAPLKVLTAEHCLTNLTDGGVEVIDPVATQQSGKIKWMKSSKVYVSQNPEYRKIIEKKYKLSLEMEELMVVISVAATKLGAFQPAPGGSLLGSLFSSPRPTLSKEEEAKLQKTLQDAMTSLEKLSVEQKSTNDTLSLRYPDHDLAVLVFPGSLQGSLSVEQRVKNREILPIARTSSKDTNVPVVIGGYGITSTEAQKRIVMFAGAERAPQPSHFTTNVISKISKKPSVYSLFGNTNQNLKKAKIAPGTMGAPLPGDSGSGVLSEDGILGVTSYISFYSSHVPPAPNWVNLVEDPDAALERYEYIMAHFPSTTSSTAQALFADVEASSGPLVYADQAVEYAKTFLSEKQSILETGKAPIPLEIFKNQEFGFILK